MKKIVIIYGCIAGLIVAGMMAFTTTYYCKNGDFDHGMIYGYTAMIVAFSMIFVGIKSFRDKYDNGAINFGKAFKIGLFITLIASTFYVVVWLIDYYCFIPDFGDKYAAYMLAKAKAHGASAAEIAKQTAEMVQFKEMYKNPFFVVLMTYAEIIPVGLIVTLISALVLKRKTLTQTKVVTQ